uniref:sensor histidine kinase n=1 Tax=Cellvibrio fontiphilus TaxID=1815559 RepID=UPI002B4BD39C|nr:ATP-binding protein [Cellvibrio fontiphilus]
MPGRLTPRREHPVIMLGAASLLILVGLIVLSAWHAPQLLQALYPFATLMAYNTALGFLACGLGLVAILKNRQSYLLGSVAVLWGIGLVTLIDLLTELELHTTDWFEFFLSEPPTRSQPISPVTSSAFLLAGGALLLARQETGNAALAASLTCILIILITTAALLGQGFGLLPHYLWLGIKIAPQTVLGLVVFAVAIISLRAQAAIDAFNRLNFFNRLVTGFGFMSLLFLAIGSIAMMQINSVANISQELYSGPVQVTNATLRIKAYVGKLNRSVKDIAVAPELMQERNLPQFIQVSIEKILNEVAHLDKKTKLNDTTHRLRSTLTEWQTLLLDTYQQLQAGNIEHYRNIALINSQEYTQQLEQLCDEIIAQSQTEMQSLNDQALLTKNHAGNLMLTVMFGVLLAGFFVAALITRSLSWQLQQLRMTMIALAQGNTTTPIPFLDHPKDVGDMAKTLRVFARNIDEKDKSTALLASHQTKLENINHQLAQTNKELETFAYVASHDLKSPLRGIAQLSTWIDEDLQEQQFSEVNKHTVMLRNRIQRMEKLLDDLLIFYRAGKTDGNLVEIDVAHMAKELFEIQNTKPGLRLELADNLPRFTTLSTPFEQILRNFFSNAIKHHDLDHGVIRIACQQLPNHFYEFSICDDGPGIPEKFQQRVFGMFQTLKPRDELEGSGMGLALIKKIVANYGGQIRLESAGRGCCFYFSWPEHIIKVNKNE